MVDWANSDDVEAMHSLLPDRSFDSELRLFCIACASRVLQFLPEPIFSEAIRHSTLFATADCSDSELQQCVDRACALIDPHIDIPTVRDLAASSVIDACSVFPPASAKVSAVVSCAAQAIAQFDAESAGDAQFDATFAASFAKETRTQCELLRSHVPNSEN